MQRANLQIAIPLRQRIGGFGRRAPARRSAIVPRDARTGARLPASAVRPARSIGYRSAAARVPASVRPITGEPSSVVIRSFSLAQSEDPRDSNRVRLDQASMAAVAAGDRERLRRDRFRARRRGSSVSRERCSPPSPAEAEEVVQEALLRLWQQAPTWQPNGRISTWLHQVTYRLCIDRIRRTRPAVEIDSLARRDRGRGHAASRCTARPARRCPRHSGGDRSAPGAAADRDPPRPFPGTRPGRRGDGHGSRRERRTNRCSHGRGEG